MSRNPAEPQPATIPPDAVETRRTLFRLLPVGVSILDREGNIRDINPALMRILDLTDEGLRTGAYRQRRYLRSDGSECPAEDCPTARVLREGVTVLGETIGVVKEDGATVWVEVSAAPLSFPDAACVAVTVDITALKQAQASAEDNQRFASALAENMSTMLGYWNRDQICTFANSAYVTWFGRTPQQMLGTHIRDLLGEELYALNRPYIEAALRGEDQQFERRLTRTNGEERDVLAQYAAHKVEGETSGFFVIITDITDLKRQQQLAASEQQYRRLAEDMPVYIATGLPDGTLTYVNQPLAAAFAMTQAAMTGVNFYTLLTVEDRIMVKAKMDALTPEAPLEIHVESYPRENGETVYLRWTNRGFFDEAGVMTGFQSVGQDISERMRAEDALRELNRRLEERVSERTRELDNTCDALRLREQQFQLLAADLVRTEDRERRRIARVLHDNQQQLLVAAKLALSRMADRASDQGVRQTTREVLDILNDCIEDCRALTLELAPPIFRDAGFAAGMQWLSRWMLEKHDLIVDLNCDPVLPALPEETSQTLFEAVRELLFNIAKHSGVRRAHLQLRATDGGMTITVSDRGCGFNVVEAVTRLHTFGLFNIRERLALLDGRLSIESAVGQGCVITLEVPGAGVSPNTGIPAQDAGAERDAACDKPFPDRRIRVLVADDHTILRQGVVQLLSREQDLDVVGEAVDGQDAVEKALMLKPDLILMDVSMPGMNGLEATRRLSAELPLTRIVGLSMHARDEMAEAMLAAGACSYLVKSCPMEDILTAVRQR